MLLVISPAKSLNYEAPTHDIDHTMPDFMVQSTELVNELKKYSPSELSILMNISDKLAQLNVARYQAWSPRNTKLNAKQALLVFTGDVYIGLNTATLNKEDLTFSQTHIRILSGLYGLLRPLDLIQAYRLEMGIKLSNPKGKNLYQFWDSIITKKLNEEFALQKSHTLINLASNEYFKSIQPKKLNADIIQPVFKDFKNGQYKIISFYAKKARGLMCRYIIDNKIKTAEPLKGFNYDGYNYNANMSSEKQWVFIRYQST